MAVRAPCLLSRLLPSNILSVFLCPVSLPSERHNDQWCILPHICNVATSQGSFCPALAPTDQETGIVEVLPWECPSSRSSTEGRTMWSTGAPQSKALKRKEREAPQESPRARKKVMRAPATSLSCGNTCLEHKETGTYQECQA